MIAKIIATDPAVPGEAQLLIRLRGIVELVERIEFSLLNNQRNYLQEEGQWSPAPHWFGISGGYPLQSGSGFRVGATVVDPLLVNASPTQINVKLASGEIRHTTLQVERESLFPSSARGEVGEYGSCSVIRSPDIDVPPLPDLDPVEVLVKIDSPAFNEKSKVESAPLAEAASKSKTPQILVGVAMLLMIGTLIFWFSRSTEAPYAAIPVIVPVAETVVEPITTEPTVNDVSDEAVEDGCSVVNLATKNELEFVQACFAQQPPTDTLLAVIQRAKLAQKCGVAQRLYANRAQGGDSKVALAYAREYDPKFHQPNDCFKESDNATAAYWYDIVLQVEPNNSDAKQRYEELSK